MKKVFLFILVAIGLAACERTEFEQLTKVSSTGTENGYEYVDMGTSVMWATCNVGTSTPNTYGNAYAWGEIYTKNTFNADNYSYYADGNKNILLKYNTLETFGNIDNLTTLEASDDVATQQMGGAWRMPTALELQELISKCLLTGAEYNGVRGIKLTAPNGNVLFLPSENSKPNKITAKNPADGIAPKASTAVLGWRAVYWSSSLAKESPYNGYGLYVNFSYVSTEDRSWTDQGVQPYSRADGYCIRAVCKK
jgi:hypothetical protein